ncbi:MAG: DNA polymerase IV [Propionibacteriaceae bacterium]|jgi:DNA polymerase-4|nr:DNA polymerase IV [Propionibacteriaceae bacterium]
MRAEPSILHLDLDAFFASVEQRDKPSLRGRPVVVGGLSGRGVVSTASYEARPFGVHSAMPMREARRLLPQGAFLAGRFAAYRLASRQVMAQLACLSPLVEPLSLDEAYVDLAAGGQEDFSLDGLNHLAKELRAAVTQATGGLTASVGIGSSKFMAKLASEAAKPDGLLVIPPGTEADRIARMDVRAIPGVGPATAERLARLGISTVTDLRAATPTDLRRELGGQTAEWLSKLAYARDDRQVNGQREVKSISLEDTFEEDYHSLVELAPLARRSAELVGQRLRKQHLFARTITLKLRLADLSSHTRSRTLVGAIDSDETLVAVVLDLLAGQEMLVSRGVRLLGVGVSGFTNQAQEALFEVSAVSFDQTLVEAATGVVGPRRQAVLRPGDDVIHEHFGPGWVWGSGLGRITVRFETAMTGPGPIRTLPIDDPALRPNPVVLPADDGAATALEDPMGETGVDALLD